VADIDLLFQEAPLSQPADLVFGEEAAVVDFTVDLAATMPALKVQIGVGEPSSATLVATMPPLHVNALVASLTTVSVAAALPGLKVNARVAQFNAVTLAATLPALKVAAALAPRTTVDLAATLPALKVAMSFQPPVEISLAATLPPLHVAAAVAVLVPYTVAATMPALSVTASAVYTSDTQRPTVGTGGGGWADAIKLDATIDDRSQSATPLKSGAESRWSGAIRLQSGFANLPRTLQRTQTAARTEFSAATPLGSQASDSWRELQRTQRPAISSRYQTAQQVATAIKDAWQERFRDRRPTLVSPWGKGQALGFTRVSGFEQGKPLVVVDRSDWEEAILPGIGFSGQPVVVPPKVPCYTPPQGNEVFLLFQDEPGTADLVFVCEQQTAPGETPTVIVPIRRVYLVNNSSSLHRVDTGQQIPAFSMQLALDVDSWTWGFTAALPFDALPLLARQDQTVPVELAATINGVEYRVIFEKYTTTRQFGQMPALAINCRGKQAVLDAPYAPVTTFINTSDINANQLMLQALSVNNVPLGWDVDFQLEDWIVPANQFALTGSYMGAVTQIAAAAGGYIQPSPVAQTLRALSRYPVAPWNWQDAHIDFELPSDVTTVEGIEFLEKIVYNHVFVTGTSAGVTGSVTRAGTAGDMEMPMVSDPLIGDVVAARQRGRVALSDTGQQEIVTLTLPVLPETGIILPGAMVRYVDTQANNKTRIGIVRSSATAVSQTNLCETWQTLGVETHVN
jgi:hypothetical protein